MNRDYKQMYDLCAKHMHAYVLAEMNDGMKFNGIITGMDNENVYLAVPGSLDDDQREDLGNGEDSRQYGFGPRPRPYNHFGYGYSPGYYGYGYRPGGFRRLILPLAALTAISILPWF